LVLAIEREVILEVTKGLCGEALPAAAVVKKKDKDFSMMGTESCVEGNSFRGI
jgi:hypothetical protein